MSKPLAVDLFCGAGGASVGLDQAGFHVIGCDLKAMPRYPFDFLQWDAMTVAIPDAALFVWASPPCQRYTAGAKQAGTSDSHPDLVAPVRAKLEAWGGLYCIENVPAAPLVSPVLLDGDMFGLNTYRQRAFECNFYVPQMPINKPFGPRTRAGSVTVTGHSGGYSVRDGWSNGDKAAWSAALGINWMLNKEMAEAIPPAYANFIGIWAMQALRDCGQII